jgi:hypothetical protein
VLYIFSAQSLERHLKNRYLNEIENIYLEDTRPLFEGTVRLKDAINRNINRYLQSNLLIRMGAKVIVTVTSKKGTILYPDAASNSKTPLLPSNPTQTASDNYKLMDEGLVVTADVVIDPDTFLTNIILCTYIFASILVLSFYYWSGLKKVRQEETKKNSELSRLKEIETHHADNLKAMMQDKKNLVFEIKKIKKQLKNETVKASQNEDEMIKEIVLLENKIINKIDLLNEKEQEIGALKETIKRLEKEGRKKANKKLNFTILFAKDARWYIKTSPSTKRPSWVFSI